MIKLKELRESLVLSQKDFANIIGIPANTYNQWEKGKRQPDNEILVQIANKFNITTDYLLERMEKEKPTTESDEPVYETEDEKLNRILLELFSELPEQSKETVIDTMEYLSNK